MLRIAFVTGTLQLGGSTTFLCNLAGELIRRGISCHVFCGDNLHPLSRDFERRHIPVSLHDHRRKIFEDRLEAVLCELRDYEPSVVVATLAPFAFEILRYIPRGVLRIGMVQSDDPIVYEMIEKYVDYLDSAVGVSQAIVRRLERTAAFRRVTKYYLPYGVAMPAQIAQRSSRSGPLHILYLGRVINEQKRVHLFPEIVASLEKAGVSFHWTIAGDGPDRAALETKMKGTAHVSFLGALNYTGIATVFDSHDIFILVSDYEGLPLSLLEAMSYGLVPVVSDLESGIRDIVDQSNGMLVLVDRLQGYADAIIHLERHRDELTKKSRAAHERVRAEFSLQAMADRWSAVLSSESAGNVQWPREYRISAPLTSPNKLRHSLPARWFRRLAKNL